MSRDLILQTATELIGQAGFHVHADWADESMPRLRITSQEDISVLIGREGQHVGALEHLIRLVLNKRLGRAEPLPDFMLDINDYRKAQTEELLSAVRESAKRVLETGRAESLPPMNAFERKVVHTELTAFGNLETQSIGTEPNRRVVIKRASL